MGAFDEDFAAGDVGGGIRGQESDQLRHLLTPSAADRDARPVAKDEHGFSRRNGSHLANAVERDDWVIAQRQPDVGANEGDRDVGRGAVE